MGPFLRKHRELLAIALLLVLPFVVYAAHAGSDTMPGMIRRSVVWVTSPVQRALVWSVETAQDGWYGYVDLRGTHERNESLLANAQRVATLEARLAEVEAENVRLRRMASYAESLVEMRLVAAPVLAWGPDPKYRGIRIGRGERDGVRAGMPVVTPDGVVGRVTTAYASAADVLLVTDPSSSVAVMSQRTRARASVGGTGEQGRLRLDYLSRNDDLEDGDILVTSNAGGLYPKGLRVGRAVGVTDASYGLFKRADLEPAVDFSKLEEVQVITDSAASAQLPRPLSAIPR